MEIEMCAQGNLVKSKSNKMFILCIHILLCTVLRKAKQDDSEFLVGLLPFQVEKVGWEHFHQLICRLPFWLLFLFTFPQIASSLSSFSDLMRDVHARACVDTINEDVSSLHALAVTRFLHDGKKRDCSSSNLLPPLFFF